MSKIEMNEDILNVIITVLNYKEFIYSYRCRVLKETDVDFIKEAEEFYYSLPLPNGMSKSLGDFEAILCYGSGIGKELLEQMKRTDYDKLNKFNWKNF